MTKNTRVKKTNLTIKDCRMRGLCPICQKVQIPPSKPYCDKCAKT